MRKSTKWWTTSESCSPATSGETLRRWPTTSTSSVTSVQIESEGSIQRRSARLLFTRMPWLRNRGIRESWALGRILIRLLMLGGKYPLEIKLIALLAWKTWIWRDLRPSSRKDAFRAEMIISLSEKAVLLTRKQSTTLRLPVPKHSNKKACPMKEN